MKIKDIRLIPLAGSTSEGGWDAEIAARDNLHTLVEVITDEGVVGLGSVYTSLKLVDGAVHALRPQLIGESAIEPARLSEKLHQSTFWQGRGGAITHAISGIDIALWDIFGKVTGQPVSRLLGGRYRERVKPYGSLIMTEPEELPERLAPAVERGFKAVKMGWGPFGRCSGEKDEAIVRAARDIVGPDVELMVDAVDHIQPDVTKVGGITEEYRIAQHAYDHSILFVPHGWNTAVGLAADLQLVAAVPTARWVEYITPAPYIEDLVQDPFELDGEGFLEIPDGPGLGVRWNPDGVRKHSGLELTPSDL